MRPAIDRLIDVTTKFIEERGHPDENVVLTPASAVCQDAYIFGIDVDDYVNALSSEFGQIVHQIPWGHYTDQTSSFRGCGCLLVPPWLLWRLVRWPLVRGSIIPRADPRNFPFRLELGHLAKVIDRGEWIEP